MRPEDCILAAMEAETLRFTKNMLRLRRALAEARRQTKLSAPIWDQSKDTLPLSSVADRILDSVALMTGIIPSQLRGTDRHFPIVAARHTAWWLIRTLTPQFRLEHIGQHFRRSHGAVHHGIHQVEARRVTEPVYATQLQTLVQTLSRELSGLLPIDLTTQKSA